MTIAAGLVGALALLGACSLALSPSAPSPASPTQSPTVVPSSTGAAEGVVPAVEVGQGELAFLAVCGGCHTIDGVSVGAVGPNLTHIGTAASHRKPGLSAEEYIRESIEAPTVYVVEGFEPLMPPGLPGALGATNYGAIVAYLATLS
ncbi:MAG: c-type cytochrome [Chloroflexi bacterium]|nr:c-type cytochrome [Chloroflexota bacterium]